MDSKNPYVLIISGLPHLTNRMRLNSNQSLNQRITMRYEINSLNKVEVNEYINHHFELVNAPYKILSEDAIEAIITNSRGIPRLINNLVTHALIRGATEKKEIISAEIIYEISNLKLIPIFKLPKKYIFKHLNFNLISKFLDKVYRNDCFF